MSNIDNIKKLTAKLVSEDTAFYLNRMKVQSLANSMILDPKMCPENEYALINININTLDKLAGGSASFLGKSLYGATRVYDKEGYVDGTKITRFIDFIKSKKYQGEFYAPYIVTINFYKDTDRVTSIQIEGNHRYATLRKFGVKTLNIGIPKRYLEKVKRIPNLVNNIISEANGFIGNTLGNIAGGLATTVARASGIPLVAGASNLIGDVTNKAVQNLFKNRTDITRNISSNNYFYKDEYNKYQGSSLGYDYNIPNDRFTPEDIQKIKQYLYPSFLKFGYKLKVIDKRTEDKNFLAILFKGGSTIPNLDSKRNPILYPIPTDSLKIIKDKESSDLFCYELLKLYKLSILNS